MAFNNWPYTNFQDLNLGWILQTYKEALTKAVEAFAKAVTVENTVGGYTEQINTANANANEALRIARNANEVLFISSDPENKAVNYVNYSQGETVYVTAQDIFSAITADHKVPIFMDNMLYVYELAGYETNPEQPLMVTRFKFTKESENSTDIAWIDRNGSITYTRIDGGANGFPVVFNYIPQNPELSESGYWDSDKTYAEILAAINSGRSIFLTVKIDGETRELINNAYVSKSANGTYIALGYSRGFDIYDSPYYTNTDNLLVYYTINSSEFVSVLRVFTVPSSSTQLSGRVLTVNSSGKAEWLPASGGGGGGSSDMTQIPITSSGGVYSTTMTATELLDALHTNGCFAELNGVYYVPVGGAFSGPYGNIYLQSVDQSGTTKTDVSVLQLHMDNNSSPSVTVTMYEKDILLLPATTNASADDFLMLDSNKNPAWVAVPNAANVSFGGV